MMNSFHQGYHNSTASPESLYASNGLSSPSTEVHNISSVPPKSGFFVVTGILATLSVLGIFTNVVTIVVIFTSSKLKSTFNYFIASLAVSDLTSAVISTIFLYRLTWGFINWEWPDFFCNFFWALDIWTSYVTSTHILLFSILRFVSIQWPTRFKAITLTHAKICIVLVWAITGTVGAIPFGIWFKPIYRVNSTYKSTTIWSSCFVDTNWIKEFNIYTRVMYPLFFYIPIILISTLSITIGVKIHMKRKTRKGMIGTRVYRDVEIKRRRKENQILLQLTLIVGSYLLGYITYSAYHLTTGEAVLDENKVPDNAYALFDYWFGFIEYLMLRVSECLNPIFYNLASSVMRKETMIMLENAWKKTFGRCCCSKQSNVQIDKKAPTDEIII